MPLYEFECGRGHVFTLLVSLQEWKIGPWNEETFCRCGSKAGLVVHAPHMRRVDPYGFKVVNLEQENFGTKREYNEYLKRNGLSEVEPRFSKVSEGL